jgi:phosphoglycolate phosphatase-like HAD superfamily hydrolase
MSRHAAIVFDLDGTLIDSYDAVTASMNAAREAFGRPPLPREQLVSRVGEPLEALVADLVGDDVERGVRRFRETYAQLFLELSRPLPHAAETVRALADAGLRLAVASNKPARFGRRLLEAFSMVPPIEVVLGPDETTPPKPDPCMIRRALELLGTPVERGLYVGDVPLDLTSAERAGVDVALVATGGATRVTLMGAPAPVFDDLRGLLEWISGPHPGMTHGQKARRLTW